MSADEANMRCTPPLCALAKLRMAAQSLLLFDILARAWVQWMYGA